MVNSKHIRLLATAVRRYLSQAKRGRTISGYNAPTKCVFPRIQENYLMSVRVVSSKSGIITIKFHHRFGYTPRGMSGKTASSDEWAPRRLDEEKCRYVTVLPLRGRKSAKNSIRSGHPLPFPHPSLKRIHWRLPNETRSVEETRLFLRLLAHQSLLMGLCHY